MNSCGWNYYAKNAIKYICIYSFGIMSRSSENLNNIRTPPQKVLSWAVNLGCSVLFLKALIILMTSSTICFFKHTWWGLSISVTHCSNGPEEKKCRWQHFRPTSSWKFVWLKVWALSPYSIEANSKILLALGKIISALLWILHK